MERRKFLIGAGSLAAGSAAAMGTGAFTSVQANRDINVAVADDANALLALEPTDGENADYTVVNDDGTLGIDISDGNPTGPEGSGVNNDARTIIRDVFKITNKGTQPVYVGIDGSTLPDKDPNNSSDDKAVGFYSDDDDLGAGLGVGEGYVSPLPYTSDDPLGLSKKGILLDSGETLNQCGILIYTFESDSIGSFTTTIVAASEDELGV
jgi:hypothetical protein